jgi:O-antigen ligase
VRLEVATLAVLGAGVLATLTRAGVAAFVLLLVIWTLQRQMRAVSATSLRAKLALVTGLSVLLAFPFVGASTLYARSSDVNPFATRADFAQGRGEIWAKELDVIEGSNALTLLIGHGAHSSYVSVGPPGIAPPLSPHNLVLWLLVETGIIGTLVYVGFLALLFTAFFRAAQGSRYEMAGKVGAVMVATLLAYAVLDMFILTVTAPAHRWYFMLLVGVAARACINGGVEERRAAL